jgi:phosphoribosylformimino-5-aminoimidazole carboxamide ribotide isomerase
LIVIPAIDIKGSRCVRLSQGRMDKETVYSDSPHEVAMNWQSLGASLIHIVDLDGAVEGRPRNIDAIKRVIGSIDVHVQIGGGIRDMQSARTYLGMEKVKRVIIGTSACHDRGFLKELAMEYPGRIAVGIDAKDGLVAVKGWVEVTGQSAISLAKGLEGLDISSIIYTDISRDGMLKGPNIEATKTLASSTTIPVIASGGISCIGDIEAYKGAGIEAVIVGKALYTGSVNLREAISAAKAL